MKGLTSIILPSRNEQFLAKTVADVLAKASGHIEVIAVLDGCWADPVLPEDDRVRIIHHGTAQGMRPSINEAARIASGEYLMKLDAHCMVAEGFDEVLRRDYQERNWVLVPRRYALDPEAWRIDEGAGHKGKYPIDAHYLSYPYERPGDTSCGMHGTPWQARSEKRRDVPIDDEMSSQGSCWFMHQEQWARIGELDIERYGNFIQEFQEIGNKTWLGGGAVKVTKNTWYAHLHKGTRYGRGYTLDGTNHARGRDFCTDYWMNDRWQEENGPAWIAAQHQLAASGQARNLRWLVEKFWPVPGWPADLDYVFSPDGLRTNWQRTQAALGNAAQKAVPILPVAVPGPLAQHVAPGGEIYNASGASSWDGPAFTLAASSLGVDIRLAPPKATGYAGWIEHSIQQRPTAPSPKPHVYRPRQTATGFAADAFPAGRDALAERFAALNPKKGVELGVERAKFTEVLCRLMPKTRIYAVDPWRAVPGYRDHVPQDRLDEFYFETLERLDAYSNARVVRAFGEEFARFVSDGALDFVYIDARHEYEAVRDDLKTWARKVRPGGIVSGHDYVKRSGFGVIDAVQEYTEARGLELVLWNGDRSPSWSFIQPAQPSTVEGADMLKIVSAKYAAKSDETRAADVTALVQKAVDGHSLEFRVSNETLGGDPAPGLGKKLTVEYDRKGEKGTTSASEGRAVRIPLRADNRRTPKA